jgi:hypothetical protein
MSRAFVAFVKEVDSEIDDLPDRLVSPHPNFVTAEGLAAIERILSRFEAANKAAVAKRLDSDRSDSTRASILECATVERASGCAFVAASLRGWIYLPLPRRQYILAVVVKLLSGIVQRVGQNAATATRDTKRTNASDPCITANWGVSRAMKQLTINPAESSSAWAIQSIGIAQPTL